MSALGHCRTGIVPDRNDPCRHRSGEGHRVGIEVASYDCYQKTRLSRYHAGGFVTCSRMPAIASIPDFTPEVLLPRPQARKRGPGPGMIGALIQTAWVTGCRLDELVSAERRHLNHDRRELTVIGKGNKLRVIGLDYGECQLGSVCC